SNNAANASVRQKKSVAHNQETGRIYRIPPMARAIRITRIIGIIRGPKTSELKKLAHGFLGNELNIKVQRVRHGNDLFPAHAFPTVFNGVQSRARYAHGL